MREDFGVIQSATLTLLGLIIGFTFSMAIGRYEQCKNYEEAEANAIGTEYVRADRLPGAAAACVRCSRTTSISVSCSIRPGMRNSFGRSIPLLLNCNVSCGPRSRARLQRS
jgi:hypothetical protein